MSETVQIVIVTVIVTAAFAIAVIGVVKRFRNRDADNSMCGGCTGCSIKDEFSKHQKECGENPDIKKKRSNESKI